MMLFRTFLGDQFVQLLRVRRALPQCGVRYASDKAELENPEDLSFLPRDEAELEEENAIREAKIKKMSNRSGLKNHHREVQNSTCPSEILDQPYYKSLKYRRQLYGMYGKSSGVDPSVLWPSKVELADMKLWEEVAHPYTVKELVDRAKERKKQEEQNIREQEKMILERVSKVEDEILQFKAKISKKLDKEVAVREKQEKTMKELRKYFGYHISPYDPRVAVMMEKRELEEKKAKKEAKKKKKAEMKMKFLVSQSAQYEESESKPGKEEDKEIESQKGKDKKKDEDED